MNIRIQMRQGTAAEWESFNPLLLSGEKGYETDTGRFKIGDGTTLWNNLAYFADTLAVLYDVNVEAKIDKSVLYYDENSEQFRAGPTWTVNTLTDGGAF